jgi:hypothetical protein
MRAFKQAILAAIVLTFAASVMSVSAQGPLRKRIEFSINAPFELKNSGVMLPSGNYVLLQVFYENPNVYALYKENLMHSPLATIQTVRIDYHSGQYPDKTEMLLDTDEEAVNVVPVISGWNVPGDYGWEIVSIVAKRNLPVITGNAKSKMYRKNGKVKIVAHMSSY